MNILFRVVRIVASNANVVTDHMVIRSQFELQLNGD